MPPNPGPAPSQSLATKGGKEAPKKRNRHRERVRVTRACDRCKRRKIKCDGTQPCQFCVRAKETCTFASAYCRGRVPSIAPAISSSARKGISTTQQLATSTNPTRMVSGQDYPLICPTEDPDGIQVGSNNDISNIQSQLPTSGTLESDSICSRHSPEPAQIEMQGQYIGPASGVSFLLRIQRRLRQAISISKASSIFTFGDAPLQVPESDPSFCMMLPRSDAQRLVNRYFDFAMPTYRFLHRPTLQAHFDEFYDTLGIMEDAQNASAKIALLFMVFAQARVYMPDDDRPGPSDLSTRYFLAAEHHLSREKGSIRLTSVQARLTQCYYLLTQSRINHCWSLFGTVSHLALAIGLNRNRPPDAATGLGRIEAECRRRTFWCAYTLDAYLSAALGRPRTFHDNDIDSELPACIEDEDLVKEDTDTLETTSREPSTMLAAVAHMKLAQIISKILNNLYSVRPVSAIEKTNAVEQISTDLHAWRSELGRFLNVDIYSTSFLISIFQRQRNVLNLTYWHAIILTHRPFILTNLARLSGNSMNEAVHEDARTEENLKECIDAAMNTVNTISEITERRQLFRAFWITAYFAFNATIMLYIYAIQQCASPPEVWSTYFSAATRCQSHIAAIAERGSLSERYCLVLEELRVEALRQMSYVHPSSVSSSTLNGPASNQFLHGQTTSTHEDPDALLGLAEFDDELAMGFDEHIPAVPFHDNSRWEQFTALLSSGLGNMDGFISYDPVNI